MRSESNARIEELYTGALGSLWERIELERPASYWEENVVFGRREVAERLVAWMGPLAGRKILDAGCGFGTLARRLAAAGGEVTGVDLVSRFPHDARGRAPSNPTFVVGDFLDALRDTPSFDDIVLREVLEDYPPNDRFDLVEELAEARAERLYLVFRMEGRWSGLLAPLLPEGLGQTIESVPLMREFHLHTPFRLRREQTVQRRNYRARIAELIADQRGTS